MLQEPGRSARVSSNKGRVPASVERHVGVLLALPADASAAAVGGVLAGMAMEKNNLGVYLNDHLAEAAAALELLNGMRDVDGLAAFADGLRPSIEEDRAQLLSLMTAASVPVNGMKSAAAWLSEKFAEIKVRVDDRRAGPLRRLELLEALSLGIEGKRALWSALETAASEDASLAVLDYGELITRAAQQRDEVEHLRLEAAVHALGSTPDA